MSVLPPPLRPQCAPPARKPGASWAGSSSSTPTGGSTQRDLKNPLAHSRPIVSSRPSIRLRFCTPWPEAPFQRLSIAEKASTRPRFRNRDVYMALICVAHVTQPGWAVDDVYERLAGVALAVERLHLLLGDRLAGLHVAAGQLALVERQQVRDEGDRRRAAQRRQLLFDLGPVAVSLGLVGEGVLVHRDVVHRVSAAAAGAGDALLGVDDDVCKQALLGQRRQREDARGRIAAGCGDQLGLAQLIAVELGKPVDGALEQLRRTVLAVPALVSG